MNIQICTNGDLEISLQTRDEEKYVNRLLKAKWMNGYAQEAAFLATLRPRYEQTSPANVGALTDAPLITDGENVWGFMNYQVESFLETLAAGSITRWQKG